MEAYKPPTAKLAFQSDKSYHVFLGFRGPDVRNTLVNDLYQALSARGLNVFIDSEKLEKGEIIDVSLERAIERSAIRIPIFSKGYADSVWCLKEAATMLKSPSLIIPLFYDVDPTQVRYPVKESSPYSQSFLRHCGHSDRYTAEEVEEWKKALYEICKRSGWAMDPTPQGYEALVKTVVNDLIKTLDRPSLQVAEHPVGLDSLKNLLIHKLNPNAVEKVLTLGIWGIGGIGKTTVAKAVYNQVRGDFKATFIFNVRATAADTRGLEKLQTKILKDLISYDREVDSTDEGISMFRDRLGGRRVLLILDDVDAVAQLNALVGDWLAPGSRVIITSRDEHILNVARADCIHEMSGLETDEGLQLFNWHAFPRASPSRNLEKLSKKIVEACKGHPLSLKVIGSFLSDKHDDRGCWEEALHNIISNPDIYDRLKISYNALSDDEKEIFVDIACFFIGEAKRDPIIFWKSLYKMVDTAISNLSMKSLIKIDVEGVFDMHDHLRDMGRTIAEREKQGSRIWGADHSSIISNNITRLRINGGNPQWLELLYRPGLRYLCLKNVEIRGLTKDTLAMLPPSLIWLRLEDCQYATTTKRVRKKPRQCGFLGNIWQLKTLQIISRYVFESHHISSVFSLPNIQLQHSKLKCNNLPDNIGSLSQLQNLDLSWCGELNSLPDTIGSLSQLQNLDLSWCRELNSLPDTIGSLSQLQNLNLSECRKLNSLPDTIGSLSQLQNLYLSGCGELNSLPDTIGSLSQLLNLNLSGSDELISLPDTIGSLSQLQNLDLSWCGELNSLPDTIGSLSQLQNLVLSMCGELNSLPDTIGSLSQLQNLDLSRCGKLNSLPDTIGSLSQLQNLNLSGCGKLNSLPDTIGSLSQLQILYLGGCGELNSLPDTIGSLSQLQNLDLSGCGELNSLPDTIGSLSQLQDLDLGRCGKLNSLPDTIGSLSQLQILDLSWCGELNSLPDTIGNLSQLQKLYLSGCGKLNSLPDTIGSLTAENLDLIGCGKLNSLPDTIGSL